MVNHQREALHSLVESAAAIGEVAGNEKAFHELFEAFRSAEHEEFHAILKRLDLLPSCERICEWIRIKQCVFRCIELCGVPKGIDPSSDPRVLAESIVRLCADEKAVHELVGAVEKGDRQRFERLVDQYKLEPYCHLFCHWVCVVYYRLICHWICNGPRTARPNLVVELQAAGQALRQLLEHKVLFNQAVTAAQAGDADKLAAAIGGAGIGVYCHYICEWFCSWRCAFVCHTFCREFTVEPVREQIQEAMAFAKALQRIVHTPGEAERLMGAVLSRDGAAFAKIAGELGLERYCLQLCHWVCGLLCRRFCIRVCPPIYQHPWFTHVGDFSITADIDPASGLTNKAEASHGGPGYGFFNALSLKGFCPKTSPAHPGEPMAYRFLYLPAGASTPIPITGTSLVSEVLVGSRYTLWNGNPWTLQSVRIRGAGPTPTPPTPSPSPAPPDHFIVPDPQGWVLVDQQALDDAFDGWLMGLNSVAITAAANPPPGGPAGTAVAVGDQKNGMDVAVIFQATRASTIAAVNGGVAPDYFNQLSKIHLNNWSAVALIDLEEFAGGIKCTPVKNALHVMYTTDHELMAQWYIDMTTAATVMPAPVFPGGAGPRGGAGVDFYDTSAWPSCSYLLKLHTRRALTNGLLDDPDDWTGSFLTFCIRH